LTHLAATQDLKLDKLITDYFKLEDINDVANAMGERKIKGRWVCKFD
jgi:Zn-dependent alcohol dehydrogenase